MIRLFLSLFIAIALHTAFFMYPFSMNTVQPAQLVSTSPISVSVQQMVQKKQKSQDVVQQEVSATPPVAESKPQGVAVVPPTPVVPPSFKPSITHKKIVQPQKPPVQVAQNKRENKVVKESIKKPHDAKFSPTIDETSPKAQKRPDTNKAEGERSLPARTAVVEAQALDQYNPKPQYPSLARKRGWQGVVILNVHIAITGKVASLTVHQSSGRSILDKAALKTVKKWRFIPETKNGTAQSSHILVPVHFKLQINNRQ